MVIVIGTLANSVPVLPDRLCDVGTQDAREKKIMWNEHNR